MTAKEKTPPDSRLIKLGNRIKELRIKKGYSSHENFAYDHEFNRAQWGRYEAGQDDPRYTTLLKIAKSFDMTLSELLKEVVD